MHCKISNSYLEKKVFKKILTKKKSLILGKCFLKIGKLNFKILLTLFRPGGAFLAPPPTFYSITSEILGLKPSNFVTFHQIYLAL